MWFRNSFRFEFILVFLKGILGQFLLFLWLWDYGYNSSFQTFMEKVLTFSYSFSFFKIHFVIKWHGNICDLAEPLFFLNYDIISFSDLNGMRFSFSFIEIWVFFRLTSISLLNILCFFPVNYLLQFCLSEIMNWWQNLVLQNQ